MLVYTDCLYNIIVCYYNIFYSCLVSKMHPELDPLGSDLRKRIMTYRGTKEYTDLGRVAPLPIVCWYR
jgi:hypothetical protein